MIDIDKKRYKKMKYKKFSNGLKISSISLGLWYNFGSNINYDIQKNIIIEAFNNGITYFDLANNYGPPVGHAEIVFGKILKDGLIKYRDEILISTKAGYDMWKGIYGSGGTKKHLISSINQSLERLNINYVDIFYHHKHDKDVDLNETVEALEYIIKSGKALYIGLSNYPFDEYKKIEQLLRNRSISILAYQPSYSLLNREIENDYLIEYSNIISYSSLYQGILSNKYLDKDYKYGRINDKEIPFITKKDLDLKYDIILKLNEIAVKRNQTLSQFALSWLIFNENVVSSLIGVKSIDQLKENLECLNNLNFTKEEIDLINLITK